MVRTNSVLTLLGDCSYDKIQRMGDEKKEICDKFKSEFNLFLEKNDLKQNELCGHLLYVKSNSEISKRSTVVQDFQAAFNGKRLLNTRLIEKISSQYGESSGLFVAAITYNNRIAPFLNSNKKVRTISYENVDLAALIERRFASDSPVSIGRYKKLLDDEWLAYPTIASLLACTFFDDGNARIKVILSAQYGDFKELTNVSENDIIRGEFRVDRDLYRTFYDRLKGDRELSYLLKCAFSENIKEWSSSPRRPNEKSKNKGTNFYVCKIVLVTLHEIYFE